jgi:hypothetical protein
MEKSKEIQLMMPLNDFDLSLSTDDILRGQGADPVVIRARKPALLKAAERAIEMGLKAIHPSALIRELHVEKHGHDRIILEDSHKLTGTLVTRHLAGALSVAAVLCTIGTELEEISASLFSNDPLLALALDGLGNAAVETLGQQVCRRIGDRAQADSLTASTLLSPGEPEWPVETGQPQIFKMVDAKQAGIQLTPGGMMVPKKSISFVLGIGPHMTQLDPCEVCSFREKCHYHLG